MFTFTSRKSTGSEFLKISVTCCIRVRNRLKHNTRQIEIFLVLLVWILQQTRHVNYLSVKQNFDLLITTPPRYPHTSTTTLRLHTSTTSMKLFSSIPHSPPTKILTDNFLKLSFNIYVITRWELYESFHSLLCSQSSDHIAFFPRVVNLFRRLDSHRKILNRI